MAVAVVLALIILLGVIKKLIKLVLVAGAILVLWVAYMVWAGEEVSVETIKEELQSGVEAVKEKASKAREDIKESVEKSIEEKTENQLNKILPNKNNL
jgi:phage-related minor tail protein